MEFMSWEKQPPLVGSSRMTGMSFTSEEAFFKRLSPVHFKLLERSGGAAPCLEEPASVCGRGFSVSQFLFLSVGRGVCEE